MVRTPSIALAVVLCTLGPGIALATSDSGYRSDLYRMSADGKRGLIASCDVQGEEGTLEAIALPSGKVLGKVNLDPESDVELEGPYGWCFKDAKEIAEIFAKQKKKIPKAIRKLVKKHGLSVTPVTTARSPGGERYVLVTVGYKSIKVRLFEGNKETRNVSFKRAPSK